MSKIFLTSLASRRMSRAHARKARQHPSAIALNISNIIDINGIVTIMLIILIAALFASNPALAQRADPAKVSPVYQQQRNAALDGLAACSVSISEMQAKIDDLEKKLKDATDNVHK